MLRRSLFHCAFIGVLSISAAYAGPAAAFQGKWELDKKEKVAGAPEDLRLEIQEDGSKVLFKSQYREPKNSMYPLLWIGVMIHSLELSSDGAQKENQIGPFMHSSKTTFDGGNKMITDYTAALENGNVTGQWIHTVSPDGKTMTWEINSKASDGRALIKTLNFKKK